MKLCPRCQQSKPETKFGKNKGTKDGLRCYCRGCIKELNAHQYEAHPEQRKVCTARWHKANAEKLRVRNARWRKDNPNRVKLHTRRANLKRYGITIETFNALLTAQYSKCAICGTDIAKKPCLDHCHKTGKIRGLLCQVHNTLLGFSNDSPQILRRAAEYLETTEAS
jgi:hypothetical protein